jgi:hypothetical protein
MSTANIIEIIPTRVGCTVTFKASRGPRSYSYPYPGALAIMAGEDPAHYPCNGEVNPLTANASAVGEIIEGAASLLEDVAEIAAEAALL